VTDQLHPTGAAVSDRDSAAPAGLRPGDEAVQPRRPRAARSEDVAEILRLVRELADYERSLPEVTATAEDLAALLFGPSTPAAHCLVIDADEPSGGLAGMALWFLNASTWTGRHGIYLEDLYVSPEYRGRGYGRALMATLAALCRERGYARLEWSVLDWNTPALDFYGSLGARAMDEWTVHRIAGDALAALADEQPGRSASGPQP
jgi:GNAT superfamily N-acetyltransferase